VTSKPDFKVMVLLLVFMQLTRDLFAIAKFLFHSPYHFFANFGLPGYSPWTFAVNVTWMERGFNAGQMCSSIHIYLQPFKSYSEILVGNCNFILHILHLAPSWGVPIGIPGNSLVLRKLETWGYQAVKTVWRYVEPFRHNTSVWQTDKRTDRRTAYSYTVRSMTDAR